MLLTGAEFINQMSGGGGGGGSVYPYLGQSQITSIYKRLDIVLKQKNPSFFFTRGGG